VLRFRWSLANARLQSDVVDSVLLPGSIDPRSGLTIDGEALHALELDRSTSEDYAVENTRRMPDNSR